MVPVKWNQLKNKDFREVLGAAEATAAKDGAMVEGRYGGGWWEVEEKERAH